MKDKIRKLRRENSTRSLMTEFQLEGDLSRRGSISSLKSLGKDLIGSLKKKGPSDTDSVREEENGDTVSMETKWIASKSKKFGRRLSSLFDSPKKLESGARRHSLAALSIARNNIFFRNKALEKSETH